MGLGQGSVCAFLPLGGGGGLLSPFLESHQLPQATQPRTCLPPLPPPPRPPLPSPCPSDVWAGQLWAAAPSGWRGALVICVLVCQSCWPQPRARPGCACVAPVRAQCRWRVQLHPAAWKRGCGLSGTGRGPVSVLPACPGASPAPWRGRGTSVSTQLYRQETGALRAQGTGVGGQVTQLVSRVPGCSLQVQALVSCTGTFAHAPAPLPRLRPLRTRPGPPGGGRD